LNGPLASPIQKYSSTPGKRSPLKRSKQLWLEVELQLPTIALPSLPHNRIKTHCFNVLIRVKVSPELGFGFELLQG
jgi:hypothetical protein